MYKLWAFIFNRFMSLYDNISHCWIQLPQEVLGKRCIQNGIAGNHIDMLVIEVLFFQRNHYSLLDIADGPNKDMMYVTNPVWELAIIHTNKQHWKISVKWVSED